MPPSRPRSSPSWRASACGRCAGPSIRRCRATCATWSWAPSARRWWQRSRHRSRTASRAPTWPGGAASASTCLGRSGPIAAFLAMDYGFYLWHVATHRLPFLWRFHRIHHVDPDMDMTTAIRFHLVDMLVSLPWRMLQVRASGIDPAALVAWQRFFTLSILFHHSNWALPRRWDRRLALLLTTPRMHGIHHSTRPRGARQQLVERVQPLGPPAPHPAPGTCRRRR